MIYLAVIVHLCAVLVCVLWLAYHFRVSLVETAPVFVCMLTLVLYGLAMLGHLSGIDGIVAAVLILFACWLCGRSQDERRAFWQQCRTNMTETSFLTAVFLIAAVAVCTCGKVVSWWDDINFWAADVKSLYFLDGFAGKYGNVAPEFGDYPPAAQLMKWWFLHFDRHTFREGLAFVGYYVMNLSFLLPLLRKLRGKNVPVMVLTALSLWFLPSIAEVYGYSGFCADLTMACIYGGFLLAVIDRRTASEVFYYGRLALYLGVLVLVKSIGFVWALFGLVFFMLYQRCGATENADTAREATGAKEARDAKRVREAREATGASRKRRLRATASVIGVPLITGASWMLFCLSKRRVTKTTATAVKYMTTDEYGISGYTREFAQAFLKAFVGSPLHKDKTPAIDLTPLGCYLCICLFVMLFYKTGVLAKRTGKAILWFTVVSGVLFYAVIFVAHITIFATETQYLEASGMISSIERYGAPFTVGTLIWLAGIWLESGERFFKNPKLPAPLCRNGVYLGLILFVALTAGYRVGYDGLVGYRGSVAQKLEERADMLGQDEERFLRAIGTLGTDNSTRVCYIRRGDAPRWVNNSYTSYEASPVSVVYRSVNLDDAPTDWMVQEIRDSHAVYLYAEQTDADVGAVFDGLTAGEGFACETLYRIEDDGTNMKLTQVSQ